MDNKCAFDHGDKGCLCLNEKECEGCHFFKTCDELEGGREKAANRVSQLEPALKGHIRHKYYGDRRRCSL